MAKRSFDIMVKLNSYVRPAESDSVADRVAHFLDWAAKEMPHLPVPWNLVYRAIMGLTRTPTLASKDVMDLRRKSNAVRNKLFNKYKRELVSVPAQGVCATVGSDHVAATRGKLTYSRIVSATKSFDRTMSLVNPKEMKDPQLKSWVERTTRALGDMGLSDRLNKLVPPAEKDAPASKRGVEKK